MERFIACDVDGDLSQLIISGTPAEEELQKVWQAIVEEFSELVKNEAQQQTNELVAECTVLQSRIHRIVLVAEALQYVYSSDLVALLRSEDVPFAFNPDKPAQYYKDIKGTIDRTRGLNLQLKLKQAELDEWYAQVEKSSAKKKSRASYDEVLAALTESNGFLIDEATITVTQYARLLNRHMQKMIAQQREIDKRSK